MKMISATQTSKIINPYFGVERIDKTKFKTL